MNAAEIQIDKFGADWRRSCPVCGAVGLKRVNKRKGLDAIYYCRNGHPHYRKLA